MNVLLGIAGSEESDTALRETVSRTAETGDDLTIAVLEEADHDRSADELERRARDLLDEFDVEATVRRVSGDPGSELVELAESEGFDRLVIGGGRRSPMGKIQLGSITEFVLLNAQVSVTLIR